MYEILEAERKEQKEEGEDDEDEEEEDEDEEEEGGKKKGPPSYDDGKTSLILKIINKFNYKKNMIKDLKNLLQPQVGKLHHPKKVAKKNKINNFFLNLAIIYVFFNTNQLYLIKKIIK